MAAPIDIEKNCFYVKHNITTAGATKLLPTLTDCALSGTSEYHLEGGTKASTFLLSGATPPALTYGDGTLVGGDLVLYCSGTNLSTSGSPAVVDIYSAVSGTTFSEGGMSLSHGWESLGFSGSIGAGSQIITGSSTSFKTDFNPGDDIKLDGYPLTGALTIVSIESDTRLTFSETAPVGAISSSLLYKARFYGDELSVYAAHADNSLYTYSENFDGSKDLGWISIPGFKASEPYVELTTPNANLLARRLYAGGNLSLTYGIFTALGGEGNAPTGSAFFKEYFGTKEDGGRDPPVTVANQTSTRDYSLSSIDSVAAARSKVAMYVPTYPRMYIKPLDDSKMDDLWVPANDFRTGMENIYAFTPYWRWKDIKGLVSFKNMERTDVEESEDVNPNNTIFDSGLIYASPNLSTFYGGGDEAGVPVNKSIIQISTETYDDGGSALQLYNLWSYSTLNAYSSAATGEAGMDPLYGISGAANAQFTCVGMKNVPYPQQIDNAFWTEDTLTSPVTHPATPVSDPNPWGATELSGPAWDNATLPEINVKFNVKEMDMVPTVASSLTGSTGDQQAEQGIFTDYMRGSVSSTASTNRYTDACYISGTRGWAFPSQGPFDFQFRTLMRNFTICFSNYPPTEGENLDAFLHRGLKDYYSGTTAGNLFVGGLTIFRDRPSNGMVHADGTESTMLAKGVGQNLTAMPLPVSISPYTEGYASGSPADPKVLDIDDTRNRIFKFNNCSGNTAQSADIMCFSGIPSRARTTSGDVGQPNGPFEESVNLSMDQFVNAKFSFNVQGGGSGGNPSTSAVGGQANRGYQDMCRVYFTDGVVENEIKFSSGSSASSASVLDAKTVDEPLSLPIYFPQSTHTQAGGLGQTWVENPSLWPRYMTFWVTNYRQTNDTTTDTDDLLGEKQPWSNYTANFNKFGLTSDYPALVGGDKQTSVFVDTITFSNFTNSVFNASVKSTGLTDNIIIKQWPIKSVVAQPPDWYGNMIQDENRMFSSVPQDYYMPTYVLMGFDNGPADYFISGGLAPNIGAKQWYQWHGFGSSGFQNLERQSIDATSFNQSWYKTTSPAGFPGGPGPISSYGNYLTNSWYSYMFYTSGANVASDVTKAAPAFCTGGPTRGYRTTAITTGATQPTATSDSVFNIATGSDTNLFTDGLTQKGFTQLGSRGVPTDATHPDDYVTEWAKREHPYVASKIISIPEVEDEKGAIEKGMIEVDNGAIFDMPLSDEYILYTVGGGTGSMRTHTEVMSTDRWDYETKDTTMELLSDITSTDTDLAIESAEANPYVDSWFDDAADAGAIPNSLTLQGLITTGSYIAMKKKTGGFDEIIKVEQYTVKTIEDSGTDYDQLVVARGQMGTTAAARAAADYYFYPIKNVYALKGITQRKARDGNNIFLDTQSLDALVTDGNLPYLYISPYKYWQWLQMWPGAAEGNGGVSIPVDGATSSAKAYSAISLMKSGSAATTATGTTYSEEGYTWVPALTGSVGRTSPYNYLWNLDTASSGSSMEVNQDFGHGVYTADTRTGGEVASRNVFAATPNAFNLDGLVANNQYGSESPVVNKLTLAEPLLSSSVMFYGNDYTTTTAQQGIAAGDEVLKADVQPYYLWKFFDPVPTVSDFTVGPAFNVLQNQTDLYSVTNENLTSVKFNWQEGGEDIWYRMLIVDDKAVYSKYHGFNSLSPHPLCYGALNEVPTSVTTKPTLTFKDTTTDSYGTTFEPTVGDGARMSPEGLQGYALHPGTGAADAIYWTNTQSKMILDAAKYTAIFHLIPGVYTGTTAQTIFSRGTLAAGGLIITMESGKIKVTMGGIVTPLSSNTVSPRDGKQPMMVAVVYDQQSEVPCKLFINGKLEDYSITGTTPATESVNSYIGNDTHTSGTKPYYGLIEEVIFYGDVIHFPDDTGEYILDGSKYIEYTGSDVQSLHAKLFVMDYHNIRGDGKDVLCSSPTVSWRPTIG